MDRPQPGRVDRREHLAGAVALHEAEEALPSLSRVIVAVLGHEVDAAATYDAELLAEGPVLAIHQSDQILNAMDDWNRRQHGASGLTARVRASSSARPMFMG